MCYTAIPTGKNAIGEAEIKGISAKKNKPKPVKAPRAVRVSLPQSAGTSSHSSLPREPLGARTRIVGGVVFKTRKTARELYD